MNCAVYIAVSPTSKVPNADPAEVLILAGFEVRDNWFPVDVVITSLKLMLLTCVSPVFWTVMV